MNEQHLNTGAAALGALDAEEQATFDAHLAQCEPCRAELRGLQETAARLATLTEVVPPASLRAGVLAEIRRTPQLPPVEVPADDVIGEDAPQVPAPPIDFAARRRRPPIAWLSAAAAAVLAIGVTTGIMVNRDDPAPPSAQECVAQASDARNLTPAVGSGGGVNLADSCAAAVVTMPNMPALPDGHVYQLWVMAGSDARSVGLVGSQDEMVLSDLLEGDTDIGVSIEPGPDGSPTPTTSPIWVVTL